VDDLFSASAFDADLLNTSYIDFWRSATVSRTRSRPFSMRWRLADGSVRDRVLEGIAVFRGFRTSYAGNAADYITLE
jgi:hypothetical protein